MKTVLCKKRTCANKLWMRLYNFDDTSFFFFAATNDSQDRNGNAGADSLENIPDAVPVELTEAPIEDQLAWHTLWPESHKLYGHGNELFSLCCDHQGELVASSCKVHVSLCFFNT